MNIKKILYLFLALSLAASPVFAQAQELDEVVPEKISLNFKDTDIRVVLQALSEKGQVNIVPAPEVTGSVSIKLKDVDWETALEVLLRTYDYGYAKFNDIVMVAPLEKIQEREAQEKAREAVEPPQMRTFDLMFIDANDAISAIRPMLSANGRISVLQRTGQAGWEFGDNDDISKRERAATGRVSKSRKLIVTDIVKRLDAVEKLLVEIDVMPKQILIQTKILEINHGDLEDIGMQWSTGTDAFGKNFNGETGLFEGQGQPTGKKLGSDNGAFTFDSLASSLAPTLSPDGAVGTDGLEFLYRKLGGTEFQTLIRALEEKKTTNVLSTPSILTLNNQEATILVGEQYPIIETEVNDDGRVAGGSLDEYQDIGVQLNVIPQLSGDGQYISMIVHPAVTSLGPSVTVNSENGEPLISYPRIDTREAETQIIMRNGESLVIGGLIKDINVEKESGIPLIKDIPVIGKLFRRDITEKSKVDLLIFITAKVVEPGEIISEQLTSPSEYRSAFGRGFPEEGTYIEVVKEEEESEEETEEEMEEEAVEEAEAPEMVEEAPQAAM